MTREPGRYSICPLCEEHFRYPDPPIPARGVYLDPNLVIQQLFAEHEAVLEDHLRSRHTAVVILGD